MKNVSLAGVYKADEVSANVKEVGEGIHLSAQGLQDLV